jgi:hypothetical protein
MKKSPSRSSVDLNQGFAGIFGFSSLLLSRMGRDGTGLT